MAGAACRAALARSLSLDALAPCPVPAPQGSRGLNYFAGGENSAIIYHSEARYLLQICFSGSLSLLLCWWFFPLLLYFTFYLLKTKTSACRMSCIGRGCAGARGSQPLVSLGGEALLGGLGRKHNRPCSEAEMWSEQTNKVKAVKLNDYFYLFPCWFVFALPLPCPQLCAPLESSHLALVFAGHGAYVYCIYFKHSSWETDSSLWIPNTFYNQLHYWYWGWRRGNDIFFRLIRFGL